MESIIGCCGIVPAGSLLGANATLMKGINNGACFNSEQPLQLAVKALLYKYFSETPRIHGSRTLPARLRNLFMDAEKDDVAVLIGRFISDHRDGLDVLEESYIMARHWVFEYSEMQGRLRVKTAEKALEVLIEVEKRVG